MPDKIEYQGLNVLYNGYVNELTSVVKIFPILTINENFQKNPLEVTALWDTGSTVTCIKPILWDHLGIHPFDTTGRIELAGVGGRVKTDITIINLILTPCLIIEYCTVYVLDFPGDADVLIGMDIIKKGDFAVCNTNGKTSFTFAIPPFPDRINFIDRAVKFNR